jgi:hypothetical protein
MTWRNTAADAARVQVLAGPSWLLAPLFVRDGLPPALLPDWSSWWSRAVAFRPGGAALAPADLIDSPELARRWQASSAAFDTWCASRPATADPPVEQERLSTFAERTGGPPAPRTLTVLVVPFGDELFRRPEPDRLVVDAALRRDGNRYLRLLDPVFADFF